MNFAPPILARIPNFELPFDVHAVRSRLRIWRPTIPNVLASGDHCERAAWIIAAATVLSEVRPEDVRNFPKQIDPERVAWIIVSEVTGLRPPTPGPIPPATKRRIAEEQGWLCHYGGCQMRDEESEKPSGFEWHIDHKWPKSKGGSDHRVNLVASCARHNKRKHARFYTPFRIDLLLDAELARCGD